MEPTLGYHPNLTYHANVSRAMFGSSEDSGVAAQVYGDIDNSPKAVGGLILFALIGIVGLKALGFRFAIGVGK